MDEIGISLGWRCGAAMFAVEKNIRGTRKEGYMTCPFDIGVTNYIGICKCIEDDFKYFCDLKYLTLRKEPKMKKILGENQTEDQYWIYNTYYNFTFNHESPGHGNLYLAECWENGINHFVDNNFEKFIERYTNRINNFRHYLSLENTIINFAIFRYNSLPYELINIFKNNYPLLNFTIVCVVNYNNYITINNSEEGMKEFETEYLKYLNIDRTIYPEEYERYEKEFDNYDNKINDIIKIIKF